MSRTYYCNSKEKYSYDYENQVWIVEGKYQRCGHPKSTDCKCYGKEHEGEKATITVHCK